MGDGKTQCSTEEGVVEMKKVFIAIDRPGWCQENQAKAIMEYLAGEYDFTVAPYCQDGTGKPVSLNGPEWRTEYDIFVALHYPILLFLAAQFKKGVGVACVFDHYSWEDDPTVLENTLVATDVLVLGNGRMAHQIPARIKMPQIPVFVCEDGIEPKLFKPLPLPNEFVAGWCGNPDIGIKDDPKGLQFIRDACAAAGVRLEIQSMEKAIPHEDMPNWYSKISVYINQSHSEGTPNPALEALACGRCVITTDVGVMHHFKQSDGVYKVHRGDVNSIRLCLEAMRAGYNLTKLSQPITISERHFWNAKAEQWRRVLAKAASL